MHRTKKLLVPSVSILATVCAGPIMEAQAAAAEDLDWQDHPRVTLEPLGSTNLNRVGISYRLGLNMSVRYSGLGGFTALTPATNPQTSPGGRDHFNYDNGYVYSDDAPPAEYTHYYGYAAGTPTYPQNGPTYGPNFDLYHSSSAADSSVIDDSQPQHGFEITYRRQIGRVREAFWGLESGVGFMDFSSRNSSTMNGAILRQADTYQADPAGGFLPGASAYNPYDFPPPPDPGWPAVGTTPVGSSSELFPNAATITGNRSFDARVLSLRFGPYLDFPLNDRWTFSLGAGVVALYINSDFSYSESVSLDPTVTVSALPSQDRRASGSHHAWEVGGYVGANVGFALNERLRLFGGAQFQVTDDYTHTLDGKSATLRLGQAVLVTVGGSWSF